MKKDRLYLINTIFRNDNIRSVWSEEEEKYYISVVDVVGVLTESKDAQIYWRVLKKRLKDEGNETVTNCNGLKLKAQDGKYRMTDVVDIEGMFRIIESIPSKNAESIKQWLAGLGNQRIKELFDPSIAVQRAIDLYRSKDYDEPWISKRIKSIQDRKSLTDVWKDHGVNDDNEYSFLTDEVYKMWSGMTSRQYKQHKGLKNESLRDNMDSIELILTDLSEEATKLLTIKKDPKGLKENLKVSRIGGQIAKDTRDKLEENLEQSIISKNNKLRYKNNEIKQVEGETK